MISRQCKLLLRINDIHNYDFFFWWPKILTRQGPSNKKSIRYGLSSPVLVSIQHSDMIKVSEKVMKFTCLSICCRQS